MFHKSIDDVARALWRIKGTIAIQLVIIIVGVMTTDLTSSEHLEVKSRLGFDYDDLAAGRIWHLLTGTWLQSTPGIEYSMLALVFGGTVFLELLAGTRAMLLTCISADWFATVLTALTTRVLAAFGSASATTLMSTPDAGTSALAHAGYAAAVMLLPRRWLKVAIPILIFLTAIQFFIIAEGAAMAHCWATVYGGLIGWLVLRPRFAWSPDVGSDSGPVSAPPVESR